MKESYEINDSNCYRIRRLEENLYKDYLPDNYKFDDITMLMFDYKAEKGDAKMTNKTFPAKVEALDNVISFVEEALESFGCPMKTSMAICVAIEEVFVNVAHYAYGEDSGYVDFEIVHNKNSVTIQMIDKGIPFNHLEKPDSDITLSVEDREIGGLGIFITKKTKDSVSYAYENEKNILTMIKKI